MRTFPAISCALALASLIVGLASSCSSGKETAEACAPGQQVSCPCAGGGTGVQVCKDDGSGYEPCLSCPSMNDASADGDMGDAPADAPADGIPGDASSACIYPTDGLGTAGRAQPTPGTCQGDTAVTCDPTTHAMVGKPCAADQVCAVYQVTENPDPNFYAEPGFTYQWAGCIPKGATPCTFSWTPHPGFYPPGEWDSSYMGNCQNNAALTCAMAPVITDQAYFELWAGTTTGYVAVNTCASDEACADNPMSPGAVDCYAAPLVPCTPVANSACQGDVLYDCDGNPYQKKVDCTATGQVCRMDCNMGLSYQPAECRDPLPAGATACDPTTYANTCSDPMTLERCDDCFQEGGQCVCYPMQHACSDIGCGIGSSACQCADVVSQGPECIESSAMLCDPASTPDTCQGSTAETCIGYVVDTDCSQYGEICSVASGHAGCIASPATACSASMAPACNGNKITGCCPASGEFLTGSYQLPCAPGFEVSFDCSTIFSLLTCQTSVLGAACSM